MTGERQLTELEGAILTEVAVRGNDTAYKVRRAFETSPSVQWRGSAGAVSPAIRRLTAAGLIAAVPHPSRRGLSLSLTAEGERALDSWASDIDLACGVGLDPFRLRAGVWERLSRAARGRLYADLQVRLEAELDALSARRTGDISDARQTELAIALLETRLGWLGRVRGGFTNPQEKSR